jgi:hypothetical protein
MARTRLTTRVAALKNRKAESQKDGLFPGDVGNMERSKNYHDMDEYDNFEQTVNYELPDMRHDWKDNPREETGHGIPKMAKVYMAAKKATKLAMIVLGEDADEEMVTEQARDFMRMGGNALSSSINRWAEVQEMKKEEEPVVAEDDEVVACDGEGKEACNCTADEEEVVADDDEVIADEDEIVAEDDDEVVAEDDEMTADEEEVVADEDEILADEDEEDVVVDEGLIPTEIEFDEAEEGDVDADPELEEMFSEAEEGDDNEVAPVEEAPVARKAGIKRLAAQPKLVRVAAKKGADELSEIWSKWDSPTLC